MSEKELELKQKIQNSISRLNEFNAVLEQGQVVTANDLQSYLQEAHWLQQNLSAWMYAEQHQLFVEKAPVMNPMEVQVSSLKAQLDELAQMAKAKTEATQEPEPTVIESAQSKTFEQDSAPKEVAVRPSIMADDKESSPSDDDSLESQILAEERVEERTEDSVEEEVVAEVTEELLEETSASVQSEILEEEKVEETPTAVLDSDEIEEDKKELNDVISKDGFSLAKKLQASPLSDLKAAIGLNQRFAFSNELFGGNMEAFNKAVNELNHLESMEEAERMINLQLKTAYAWNAESELVNNFLELVNRRYL